ncbi:MAG: threonine--tRNA ligase [Holosporales bacterium]|jgi:threonyl-tRNA synthetase|nr:threonine--tRNA ligase [Holosporales bacterium]
MISVSLNDGRQFEIDDCSSAHDLVGKASEKNVLAARVNGELCDLSTRLKNGDVVSSISINERDGLAILRHSAAHVLAKSILELFPKAKLAIGPAIENGFYYDLNCNETLSNDELVLIEQRMRDLVKKNIPFVRTEIPKSEAIEYFRKKEQKYKVELVESIEDTSVTMYFLDDIGDLCRGPHIPSTGYIPLDAFKLTNVSGAYWRGDSKNDMLQRVYGVLFPTKESLNSYFDMIQKAQARDHRKLGVELGLFHIDDVAPGSIFWLQNGTVLFNLLKDYITDVIKRHGYYLVQTPQLMNRSLWETSGHWEKFRENMFVVEDGDTTMAIKPMNCPGHIVCYQTGAVKSYRNLPIRIAEFGLCHRNEPSGSHHGIMRLRAFVQDDGHIFCSPEQIVAETLDVCSMIKEIYEKFGFSDVSVKFSNRPAKRVGSEEIWDLAEKSLMEAADEAALSYTINEGEGAFYGPKLEFVLKDCLGREWQCGTLQADFNLPERFKMHYIDSNGDKKVPVMLHRALVGSIERFVGILIEQYAGKFPFWLSPVQIVVTSVTDESSQYAKEIAQTLQSANFRVVLNVENEKIGYKIRFYSLQKVPAIVIVGKKEMEQRTVSVRSLGSEKTATINLAQIVAYFNDQ